MILYILTLVFGLAACSAPPAPTPGNFKVLVIVYDYTFLLIRTNLNRSQETLWKQLSIHQKPFPFTD
jgi:hypothetical protein